MVFMQNSATGISGGSKKPAVKPAKSTATGISGGAKSSLKRTPARGK